MHNDIALFSELCDELFKEETNQPVAKPIPTSELYNQICEQLVLIACHLRRQSQVPRN